MGNLDDPRQGMTDSLRDFVNGANPYSLSQIPEEEESIFVKHARRELAILGEDQDVIDWYVRVIREFASFGHSGGSHAVTLPVLTKLLNFEALTPLTGNPDEWIHHDSDTWPPDGVWQNKRNSKAFSTDKGRTYYLVDDKTTKKYPLKTYIRNKEDTDATSGRDDSKNGMGETPTEDSAVEEPRS